MISPEFGASTSHCMSRTVNGERLFQEEEKCVLQELIAQAADYCGVVVLTYALMENHPHILVFVPHKLFMPDDAELLRRYRVFRAKPTKRQAAQIRWIEAALAENGPAAAEWRRRQWAQMCDLSQFMKIVKQRFTAYYNKRHNRYGPLWAGRFKSVLVEENSNALLPMAAYIDLNAVRAGLVEDPKDYRFCGYAQAIAGNAWAQEGLMRITEAPTWAEAQADYRLLLFSVGASRGVPGRRIELEDFVRIAAERGHLSLPDTLRARIRAFTDSAVLGTHAFVLRHLEAFQQKHARKRHSVPRPLPRVTDWGDLTTLRGLRRPSPSSKTV